MTYHFLNLTVQDFTPPSQEQAGRISSLRYATRAAGILHAAYNLPEAPTVVRRGDRYTLSCYGNQGRYDSTGGVRLSNPRCRFVLGSGGRWYYASCTAEELDEWARTTYDNNDYCRDWWGLCYPEDGNGFHYTNDSYRWEDGEWRLDPEPEEEEEEDGITGYHCERRLPPTAPYDLAVELEVYDSQNKAVPEVRYHGHIAEHDGSLDCGGYEIVQKQPRQLDAVINGIGWEEIVSKLPSQKNRIGYGMHVSVNATGWTRPQETTFVAFWTANEDFVCSFSGRRYCESYAQKGDDVHTDEDVALKYARSQHRYAACSVRGGGRIEVRLFRTTRQWPIFAGRVQVTDAVARWAAGCGDTATHKFVTNILGSGGLLEWMKERQSEYPYAIKLVEQWAEKEVTA